MIILNIMTSKSLIFSLHYVNLNDFYCVVENLSPLYPSHFLSDDDPLSKYCEVYSLNRLLAINESASTIHRQLNKRMVNYDLPNVIVQIQQHQLQFIHHHHQH